MLERYDSAIDKIRRIDGLKDELRALKGEDGKLSSSAAVYRKKNDRREKIGNDDAINRINDRRNTVSKREALVKAEIKSLRSDVYDILSSCFAEAKSEEHRAKIREACIYASDGRYEISEVGEYPSDFGKCKIVGKRFTRDKDKDGKVESVLRGGIRNSSGRFLLLPEIVLYVYDETRTEGEFVSANEYYGNETVEKTTDAKSVKTVKEKGETLGEAKPDAFGSRFVNRSSAIALVCALCYSAFALWATFIGGIGNNRYVPFGFGAAYVAVSAVVAAYSFSRKSGAEGSDVFSLFSLYAGALSSFALAQSADPVAAMPLPAGMFLGGLITAFAPAPARDYENKEGYAAALVRRMTVAVWFGLLACAVKTGGEEFNVLFDCILAVFCLAGFVLALLSIKSRNSAASKTIKGLALSASLAIGVASFALKIQAAIAVVAAAAVIAAVVAIVKTEK